ncbi:DUF6638 family protein [uncultured Polaribacter sp.]|uniref:DUF6638 family protein n=1 Tax=uncultured Polaribacter sp. TaxID=174711 RepID=UPI0026149BDC|nr:DUF6638 family protein [uncultured Polaribacter sp.]
MDKLKQANLYRNELILVNGKLVERYNRCLQKLGFTPTELSSFFIDGMGWSPEIAEEKQEQFYLNNGEANTHAIIITPKQKGIALYNPFHSFDKELMKAVFKTHAEKIKNITRDSALCLDFDQKIDAFYEPLDILKYKEITVKFHLINDLKKAKQKQLALIKEFKKDQNFIDEKIHQKLLDSAKKYGDLRTRTLDLDAVLFKTESFYTKAFGGIYLLRDLAMPILVFEDLAIYKEAITNTTYDVLMYHISHKELLDKLKSYNVIELDLNEPITKKRHQRIQQFMLAEYITENTHPIKDVLKDNILFKSYLNKIDVTARKKVMGLSIFLEKQKLSKNIKPEEVLHTEMLNALYKPHSSLRANEQDLIWSLLVNIAPKDVLFLYWYHKERFYKLFKKQSESTKEWIIETIKAGF